MSAGLPDSMGAADLPGNSRAEALRDIHYAIVRLEVEKQARDDLTALCKVPGVFRNLYLSRVSSDGNVSPVEFVRELQERDDCVWQRACAMVYQGMTGDAA